LLFYATTHPPRSTPFPYTTLFRSREGAQQYFDWFKYEFWRFVFIQQEVEKLAMTAIEFPPMQKGASFNLDAVKAKIAAAQAAIRSEEHTSELQSRSDLVCRLLLEK